MKWASAESPKKIATVKPIGVLKRTTGSAYVVPGGPDMYVAVIGSEKSLLRARTAAICSKWKIPAMMLVRRRPADVISLLMGTNLSHQVLKNWDIPI
jgi:hypothetical protein